MTATLHYVNPNDIVAEDNIRADVESTDLLGLAQSIASSGLMNPLTTVAIEDGKFHLEAGFRRHAAIVLGIAEGILPADYQVAVLANGTDNDETRRVRQIVENIQRHDLDPIEEAKAYADLVERGVKQKELAERVGKSGSHISKRLSLLKLNDDLQALVVTGDLPVDVAVRATKLTEDDLVEAFMEEKVKSDFALDRLLGQQNRRLILVKAVEELGQRIGGEKVFTDTEAMEDFLTSTCPDGKTVVEDSVEDILSVPADADAAYVYRQWSFAAGADTIAADFFRFVTPEEEATFSEQAESNLSEYAKAQEVERAARSKLRQAENDLKVHHREFISSVVSEVKVPKGKVMQLLIEWVLLTIPTQVAKSLCEAFGITDIPKLEQMDKGLDYGAAIQAFARKNEPNLLRVLTGAQLLNASQSYVVGADAYLAEADDLLGYEVPEKMAKAVVAADKAHTKARSLVDKIVEQERAAAEALVEADSGEPEDEG